MQWPVSRDQWRFLMRRIRERLWVKPLLICTASIVAVFGAKVSENDMFDDAFTAIARDGAGAVEVGIRLQKALRSLASVGDHAMRSAAMHHALLALSRAELALSIPSDVDAVRALAQSVSQPLSTR